MTKTFKEIRYTVETNDDYLVAVSVWDAGDKVGLVLPDGNTMQKYHIPKTNVIRIRREAVEIVDITDTFLGNSLQYASK